MSCTSKETGNGDELLLISECNTAFHLFSYDEQISLVAVKFPHLFAVSRKQQCMVNEIISVTDDQNNLNIEPRRRLSDQEIQEAAQMSEILKDFAFSDEEDSRLWLDKTENYTVKSMTSWMEERHRITHNLGIYEFPEKKIWKTLLVPPKVAFFLWTATRGRALTIDKLKKRGMIMVNRCVMCKMQEETGRHLFQECPVSRKVWDSFCSGAKGTINWEEDLSSIICHNGKEELSEIGKIYWDMTFHAVIWGIWLERNRRSFEGVERSIEQTISDIRKLLWSWGLGDVRGKSIREEQVLLKWVETISM